MKVSKLSHGFGEGLGSQGTSNLTSPLFYCGYTQVTSRCRIQSVVIDSRARKTTQCNSQLFPSCLTQKSTQ
ncbi:hypothetical protein D0784_18360 [Vibrio campbellii]|nr:hypothetical protein D0784_18360 [Vibrio campbellii]